VGRETLTHDQPWREPAVSQDVKTNTRGAFPEKLAKQVQAQISQFAGTDMRAFTFEKKKSDFSGAKSDLSIYNPDGKLVLAGRDFGDRTFFWQP
jgi:hypothetical protein